MINDECGGSSDDSKSSDEWLRIVHTFSKKSTDLKKSAKHAQPVRSKRRVIMMKSDLFKKFVVMLIGNFGRAKML
jgi:hypothetical protein